MFSQESPEFSLEDWMSTLLVRNKYDFVEFFTERVDVKEFLDNRLNDLYKEVDNITTLEKKYVAWNMYLLNALASYTQFLKYLTCSCNAFELDSSSSFRVKVHNAKRKLNDGFPSDLHCVTYRIRNI